MTEIKRDEPEIRLDYDTDASHVRSVGYEIAKYEGLIMIAERLEKTNEILLAMLKKMKKA